MPCSRNWRPAKATGKYLNGSRPILRLRALRGKSRPGPLSWKNADRTATRKRLSSLPNCWAGFPKPAKMSKPGSKSANSMTMLALEEKRKFHIYKSNEEQKRRKYVSMNNGKQLTGKIAVITGGSSGIGLATAKLFVQEGAYVFITGRRQAELNKAKAEIGKNVTAVQGDVAELNDLDNLYAAVKSEKGALDIEVANAAIAKIAAIKRVRPEHYDKSINLNALRTYFPWR